MSDEAACRAERYPAASAGRCSIIEAVPRELRAGRPVARAVADVESRFDRAEDQLAAVFAGKGDVRGLEEIEVLPLIHLGDLPAPRERCSEGRGSPAHGIAA